MTKGKTVPAWYWPKGLHDAKIVKASMQDDTLTLHIDSRGAMFDNTVERMTFLGARLKTPLPEPSKKSPVYWLSDELTELPFAQWKLRIETERLDGGKTLRAPVIVIFQNAKIKRRGMPEKETEGEVSGEL